jgi:hypothetical protein
LYENGEVFIMEGGWKNGIVEDLHNLHSFTKYDLYGKIKEGRGM